MSPTTSVPYKTETGRFSGQLIAAAELIVGRIHRFDMAYTVDYYSYNNTHYRGVI